MSKKSPRKKRLTLPKARLFESKLVQIGKSRGVVLPETFIKKADLTGMVILHAIGNCIVIESGEHPRAGWDEAMREAVAEEGNELTNEDCEWLNAPMGPLPKKIDGTPRRRDAEKRRR